jgi:hypothetical protein
VRTLVWTAAAAFCLAVLISGCDSKPSGGDTPTPAQSDKPTQNVPVKGGPQKDKGTKRGPGQPPPPNPLPTPNK